MEKSQSFDNSRRTADLISSSAFSRRCLIKSDGDAVILRIKPDLLDGRMIRDQSGHVRPRLVVCVGGRPTHTGFFSIRNYFFGLRILSQRYLSFPPHFLLP